jgi:small-conductance mechanosensitive channel
MVRRTQTQVMMALKAACDEADFNIPYPIRTVYFFDQQQFEDNAAIALQNGSGGQQSIDA